MVVIRLSRSGNRNNPHYSIVVADSRSRRDGKFIEKLGFYNPLIETNSATINKERYNYWINVGGTPSPTVKRIFKNLNNIQTN